jgi:glycosyltransferase involved in cell wall biosynthesis
MKTLTLTLGGNAKPPLAELERREAADEWPRITYYEKQLESDMLDERYVASAGGARGALYRRLPVGVALALEGFRRRRSYDAVVSWAEHFGLPMAALLKATGSRTPHVGLFSWISTPRKAAVLRRVHTHIHRIVVWSSIQYDFAIGLGIPARRLVQLRWLVDQKFWRPMGVPTDMICTAGREMRDYATFLEAIRGLSVPCHVAANAGVGRRDRWMADLADPSVLPPHVTLGAKPYPELRALYARSRFVVIPLFPTDTDNGITVMTEAMAMGKAVICSRVSGQRDLLEDGVNGLFVPPGDPRALRQAMEHLWAHPEICERMGQEGRRRIERAHTLEQFVAGVRGAVEEAVAEVRGRSPGRRP